MPSRFENTKRFGIALRHFEDHAPPEYTAAVLAQEIYECNPRVLNRFRSRDKKGVLRSSGYLSGIRNGHTLLELHEYLEAKKAFEQIMRKIEGVAEFDLDHIPFGILVRYESQLISCYGDDGGLRIVSGAQQNFGPLASRLKGMWRFFFLPPESVEKGQIATNVVFFHSSGPDDKSIDGFAFGEEDEIWYASVGLNRNVSLQFQWVKNTGEISYSLTTLPDRSGDIIAGISIFLDQGQPLSNQVIGTLCFASKCDIEHEIKNIRNEGNTEKLRETLKKAIEGTSHLDEEEKELIQSECRRINSVSISEFREGNEDLVEFLDRVRKEEKVKIVGGGLDLVNTKN